MSSLLLWQIAHIFKPDFFMFTINEQAKFNIKDALL